MSVFISYSRKDYYFAESLTFHLLRRGVPTWMDVKDLIAGSDWEKGLEDALDSASTLVLVASPNSVNSDAVRGEWTRALQRGCPIVVAYFRGADLPPELAQCDAVDFRGAFGGAVEKLVSRLGSTASNGDSVASTARRWWHLPLPPWVALVTLTLAVPSVAYLMLADWGLQPGASMLAYAASFTTAALMFAWFFCLAFLRRRMGMTQLAITLGMLALVFAVPIFLYFVFGQSALADYQTSIAGTVKRHWGQGLILCAVPLAGFCVVTLFRPEDLLRWSPTGKVWSSYRLGRVADAAFGSSEIGSRLAQIRSFDLAFSPNDEAMAACLRQQLVNLGCTDGGSGDIDATPMLLLTNRTQMAWIEAQASTVHGRAVTVIVVGTGITLPPRLDWLWRRQWIDFRDWDAHRSRPAQALPQVPNAVTGMRAPAAVTRVHRAICGVAAIMFALGFVPVLANSDSSREDVASFGALVAFAVATWWAMLAARMLKRRLTAVRHERDRNIGWIATVVACVTVGCVLPWQVGNIAVMAASLLLLIAAKWWLWRRFQPIDFWFPATDIAAAGQSDSLGQARSWVTLGWVSGCCVVLLAGLSMFFDY